MNDFPTAEHLFGNDWEDVHPEYYGSINTRHSFTYRPSCKCEECERYRTWLAKRPPAAPPTIPGVGRSAPVTTNAAGGKQSASPYRCDLLPPLAIVAVAAVLAEGAAKYGVGNWTRIPIPDHLNHALVHVFAYLAGDLTDDHLEHAATRVLFALDSKRAGRA